MSDHERAEDAALWDARARALGHTGWSDQLVYEYDQPCRLAAVTRIVDRLVPSLHGRAVLDLGCGTGDFAAAFSARGAHVTAVDISPAVIELARHRHRDDPKMAFKVADLTADDLGTNAFDVVNSTTVLQHLDAEGLRRGLAGIARTLRPGGVFLALELVHEEPWLVPGSRARVGHSMARWRQAFDEADLRLQEVRSYPHTGPMLISMLARLRRVGASPPGTDPAAASRPGGARAKRVVLAATRVLDHGLRVPTPEFLAKYRIMVARNP